MRPNADSKVGVEPQREEQVRVDFLEARRSLAELELLSDFDAVFAHLDAEYTHIKVP